MRTKLSILIIYVLGGRSIAIAALVQHILIALALMGGARIWILMGASALLTACAGSTYTRPPLVVPGQWGHAGYGGTDTSSITNGSSWWLRFDDPRLDRLIDSALARNNDLAKAALSVRESQLISVRAGDPLQFGPQATLIATGGSRLDNRTSVSSRSSSLHLGGSYTIDLWGRLARERDIARWALEASEADRETVRLNVIGTTADLYWRLAFFNQRVVSAEKSLSFALRTQQLVYAQSIAGAVSALEKREAEQAVLTQRSSLSQLRQAQVETRNALAILFNSPPGSNVLEEVLGQEPQALPESTLPGVPEGLPAVLLSRRPDLRAAELNLRQSLANVDVVRTSYYPTLALTGSAGSISASLSDLIANPAAILGVGLALPFLDLNAMRLNTEIAQIQYEVSVIQFRQALYQAFADVENALSARAHLGAQAGLQAQNVVAAAEAERLYAIRYRAGAVALRMWLDAQESLRTAELLLAQTKLSQLQNLNTLYQSLGGDAVVSFQALNSTHKCNAHPCINFVRRLPAQAFSRA